MDKDINAKIYLAKTLKIDGKDITNKDHSMAVSKLALGFGKECDLSEEAFFCGMMHDFGKYSKRFQGVLNGTNQGIDHAFSSAAFLYSLTRNNTPRYITTIEAVLGHHDGLLSSIQMEGEFNESLNDEQAITCFSRKTASLAGSEYQTALSAFQKDFPNFRKPVLPKRSCNNKVEDMLDTRMLLSCLVDADYSASARDKDPDYLKKSSGASLNAQSIIMSLNKYLTSLQKESTSDKYLNKIRNEVYDQCGKAGEQSVGLYTLTAPTGIGKTLALLNFALRHSLHNSLKHIIIVLPFLTLAEQSEKVYSNIVPDILVDHSQKDIPEEAREMASRWDAPMIITTSVRFFESLFSDRPTECRKLHNIAQSVVIFDEAQSLPANLAPATVEAINRLCRRYHCSMVFSTATQPDFGALPGATWKPVEIVPNNTELFRTLKRVKVDWRLLNPTGLERIATEMVHIDNVCAILNLRKHAAKLYEFLSKIVPEDELFYLTTDLCPAHRLEVVEKIKERQREGKPCKVISTQCIEAGVDLDFAAVYRALAPLEAIIQAAGRCNRNGLLPNGGLVVVFIPDEIGNLYPSTWYEHAAGIVEELFEDKYVELDIDSPSFIKEYYNRLFLDAHGKTELTKAIDTKSYSDVREQYKLIDNNGVQIIVPWENNIELFEEVRDEALKGGVTAALIRKAAPLTISSFDVNAIEQHTERLCFARKNNGRMIESNLYILNKGHEDCYNKKRGLMFPEYEENISII